jgi:hypothetical protein
VDDFLSEDDEREAAEKTLALLAAYSGSITAPHFAKDADQLLLSYSEEELRDMIVTALGWLTSALFYVCQHQGIGFDQFLSEFGLSIAKRP